MNTVLSERQLKGMALASLGLSFMWARLLDAGFSASALFGSANAQSPELLRVLALSGALALVAALAFPRWARTVCSRGRWTIPLGAGASLGMMAMAGVLNGSMPFAVGLVGAVVAGAGCSVPPLQWRMAARQFPTESTQTASLAISVVLGTFEYLACLCLPVGLAGLACAAFPLLSTWVLWMACCTVPADAQPFLLTPQNSAGTRWPWTFAAAIAVSSLFITLQRVEFLSLGSEAELSWPFVVAGAVIIAVAILIACLALRRKIGGRAGSWLLPAATILVNAVPFFAHNAHTVAALFSLGGHLLYWTLVYSLASSTSFTGFGDFKTMALAVLSLRTGDLIGAALGGVLVGTVTEEVVGVAMVVAMAGAWTLYFGHPCGAADRFAVQVPLATPQAPVSVYEVLDAQCEQFAQLTRLTERETEVLVLMIRGYEPKSIADQMGVTYNTIKTHLKHIYQKAGVHTKEELALAMGKLLPKV